MDLFKSWQIVRHRKWLVLIASAVCFLFLLFRPTGQLPPPTYVSSAKLILNPPQAIGPAGAATANPVSNWMANMTILSELMRGQDFLTRVIQHAKLNTSWTSLRNQIDLRSLTGTGGQVTLLQVSVTSGDPKSSRMIAEAVVEDFIDYAQELSTREYANTRKFLEGLVEEAHEKLSGAESAMMSWRESHHVLDVGQAATDRVKLLSTLQQQYASTAQKVASLQSDLSALESYAAAPGGPVPWAILSRHNDAVSGLQQRLAEARIKLDSLKQVYRSDTDVVQSQEKTVAQTESLLQEELSSYVKSLVESKTAELKDSEQRLASLKSAIGSARDTWSVARDQLDFSRLDRRIATWDKNYQDLLSDLYRARIAEQSGSREGAISIIEQPEDGSRIYVPAAPNARKRIPLAIPFSLLFGVAAALTVEYLSASMKVRTRVEETLGVPVVAVIPRLPREYVEMWDATKREIRANRSPLEVSENGKRPASKV